MAASITKSSPAEYFSKNLQQVGFSSPAKAVLTTLKESVDNSLDACEEEGILPDIQVRIQKEGPGLGGNTDLISIVVEDNGPGLSLRDIPKVFGEYLASSKFGKGRCSRGQQGIGISAAVTYAQLSNARGALVRSKIKSAPKAFSVLVETDLKNNKGIVKNKKSFHWEGKAHGLRVEFLMDGRLQLKGDGGLITYLEGAALVNPHLCLQYQLLDKEKVVFPRLSDTAPSIPPAVLPHPHTMKLGEFVSHAGLFRSISLKKFLKTAFSRLTDKTIHFMSHAKGLSPELLEKPLQRISEKEYKEVFCALLEAPLTNPSTRSVLTVGEEGLSKSAQRLGEPDFFSVVTRSPKICDHKPVVVEVAIARLKGLSGEAADSAVRLLRFANRVPLQFDRSGCAVTKAVESVNWRAYGLSQTKNQIPLGPYVFAVAVTSPFIKFKNASKETIDGGLELTAEIRLALQKAGQKLQRHIRKEKHAAELLRKKEHIEKFAPILIQKLTHITASPQPLRKRSEKGLLRLLSQNAPEPPLFRRFERERESVKTHAG